MAGRAVMTSVGTRTRPASASLAVLLAVLLCPASAGAQSGERDGRQQPESGDAPDPEPARGHIDGVRGDLHLGLGPFGSFGFGGRADVALLSEGLIDGVDDELAITFGADLLWNFRHHQEPDSRHRFTVFVPVALQWNFYVSELWSVFPELGMALVFGERYLGSVVDPHAMFGVRYHFNARNALLVRVGYPGGLQAGVTF